ncbi:DUF4089 domain-containing protein [Plastoroseomonas arctica]|uniref:DUF4089 domain-containing protein n=1 Tax=Plastoroseomonas arctica TaxID=1509237 RepID=A0AAF1K6Q1_9PROT|nr:DUF4089 domain-containing protein [Plastoroseomonas arctica]MBR0657260.1 DUF4089 domain-containing protein [Plastoroseomonas arctica]
MSPPEFDAEAYARETARLIRLPIDAAHLPGVVQNLRLAARMAAMIEARALPRDVEAAPVFIAGRRA